MDYRYRKEENMSIRKNPSGASKKTSERKRRIRCCNKKCKSITEIFSACEKNKEKPQTSADDFPDAPKKNSDTSPVVSTFADCLKNYDRKKPYATFWSTL